MSSSGEQVRVLVVDDHEMMADGVASVLRSDSRFDVVGVATSGGQALGQAAAEIVDVAVIDFNLGDMDGAELTTALKRQDDERRVVLITASEGFNVVTRAIAAGADGFVHKSSPIGDIVAAVAAVAEGEAWFPADALSRLSESVTAPDRGVGHDLTDREREVLALLANGATTTAISEGLYLSQHTVRNHVRNALTKLGAHSKLEAVAIAYRTGIVQIATDDR